MAKRKTNVKPKEIIRDAVGNKYICDGLIRPIDYDAAYCLRCIATGNKGKSSGDLIESREIIKGYWRQLAEYIMKVDPEMALNLLVEKVTTGRPLNANIIEKEAGMNHLINEMTISMTFKRLPGDDIYFEGREKDNVPLKNHQPEELEIEDDEDLPELPEGA